MSLEWWGCQEEAQAVQCRLPSCGHLVDLDSPTTSPVICLTCGDPAPVERGFVGRDYVPSADLTWPGASRTNSRRLRGKGQLLSGARVASVEDLIATVSAPKAHRLHLQEAPLSTQHRPQAGNAFLVWRASTTGCEVHGGTVELPEGGVLLLAGRGAHFHGTTFRGGAVMCAGARYSGTFQDCTFTATAFYAVHGAAVTLRRSTIARARIALTLSGSATYATLTETVLDGCHTCVIVDRGACVRARECTLTKTIYAVVVTGRSSHAALDGCAVRGGVSGGAGMTGVNLLCGTAVLRDCRLENFVCSMFGEGGGAEARSVGMVECACCFVMTCQARALVRECDLHMTHSGRGNPTAIAATGIAATGSRGRARMQIERTEVHQAISNVTAVNVDGGSALSATLCRFLPSSNVATVGMEGGGGRAVLSHCSGTTPGECLVVCNPESRLRIVGGEYEGGSTACTGRRGAKLMALDCVFRSRRVPRFAGVVHVEGSHAWLRGCRVRDGVMGVCATASEVTVTDSTVSGIRGLVPNTRDCGTDVMGGSGLTCMGGQMAVRGCRVQRCAVGLEARGDNGSTGAVALDDVRFEDCASGALCEAPSTANVTRCTFRGLKGPQQQAAPDLAALRHAGLQLFRERGDAGVTMDCVHGSVEECSFEGFSTAIQVYPGGAEVTVLQCVLRATSHRGLGLLASGNVAVEDCEFHGVGGLRTHGLVARESAVAAVRRCRFHSTSTAAVHAEGEASVAVVDSTVSGACQHAVVELDAAQVAGTVQRV